MSNLTDDQQLLLQKMIRENNTEDNTSKIREKKHSKLIRKDVSNIQNIKRKLRTNNFKILDNECIKHCNFLYLNYPNIYNKMLKDEIDIKILYSFLDVLEKIENGERTQHEASYEIGMYLKSLYVDKRLRKEKGETIPKSKRQDKTNIPQKSEIKKISYAEFKNMKSDNS